MGSRARFSKKKCWGPWGPDFRGQKRPFLLLLEYETLDRSENLSEDSSNKDLSNHVGHSYLKNQVDPPGAHSILGQIP